MSVTRTSSQVLNVGTEAGCLCLCGLKFKHQKKELCPGHLRNWDLWMRRRKRMHDVLTKKLKCCPGDLLMNSGDVYRGIKEEKLVLEYTKIENHFDKYRGNPDFWKLPCSFKDRLPPYEGTEYFLFQTKEEKNEIPVIEYVGVPDFLLEEKNIVPRTRHLKNLWHTSKYREQVAQRVAEKLLEIEPHKPDLSGLMICGSNFKSLTEKRASISNDSKQLEEPKRFSYVSEQSKSLASSMLVESVVSLSSEIKKFSLKVNQREFSEYSGIDCKENKISVMFEYFTGSVIPCEQSISFENTGQVALRLYWKQYKKLKIFREYTDNTTIFHPFKFDKNELLLLPGARTNFPIWFQVQYPGNYCEYWELTCLPKIWKTDFRLIVLLKGFAFVQNYDDRFRQVQEKLQRMIRNTTIKDLLNDMVCRGTYCAAGSTHSFDISEEELFESANLVTNVGGIRTPKYIYNPVVIAELKALYEEMKFPEDPKGWNLSIKTLRGNARKKDLFSYFETKMALYDTAKLKREYLKENSVEVQSKPGAKREKEGPKKQTEKAHKESLAQPIEKPETINYYNKLTEILRKLEKPSIYVNRERKKYLFSVTVLKTFFWQMFDQLDQLDNDDPEPEQEAEICNEPIRLNQFARIPERLLYETFDESYILRTKRVSLAMGFGNATPKPLNLKGVSTSDVKKVFKVYFSKDEANQKGAKGKIEVKPKETPKGPKNKANIGQADDLYKDINEFFDPFAEDFSSKPEMAETPSDSKTINVLPLKPTDEKKYLIVYSALCKAVEALVDTIEAFDERTIPGDILGELQQCNISSSSLYHKELSEASVEAPPDSSATEKVSIKEPAKDSQSEYFDFLQELHWQSNENTKKYFVEEEQKHLDLNIPSEDFDIESKVKESLMNVFSLEDFKRKVEPYGFKEKSAQTDCLEEDFGSIHDWHSSSRSMSLATTEGSRNIFYFLSNIVEQGSNVTMQTTLNEDAHGFN